MNDVHFSELQQRQRRVLDLLGSDLLIIPAEVPRGHISRFRQDSNFVYLTGFPEHGAVLVLDATGERGQVALFVRENSEREQIWDGFTMGVEKVRATYPADHVAHISELESFLAGRIKDRCVHYRPVIDHDCHETLKRLLLGQSAEVHDAGELFDAIKEMRMVKSPYELEQMRRAIDITGEAFHACMRAGTRYRHEYQFEAEFEYVCKMQGVMHLSFGSIVAAGNHATCQHYVDNSGPVGEGDLVLLDAGATWNHYCADLTRTFPASGRFSPIQKDLYEVVLASQKAGVEMVSPGVHLLDLHRRSSTVLVDGLKSLGLMHGDTDALVEAAAYREYWPGFLSHSLGIDVHDVTGPRYREPGSDKRLKPGMVITVEPGFYSQAFNLDIPEAYRQIGIRIEDDILVTEDGHENLSSATVKELADVEALVQSGM